MIVVHVVLLSACLVSLFLASLTVFDQRTSVFFWVNFVLYFILLIVFMLKEGTM